MTAVTAQNQSDGEELVAGNRENVLADKRDMSRQISDNNRYIAFGLVAITYVLLSSESAIANKIATSQPFLVICVGAAGALGVIFDYAHYVIGLMNADKALKNNDLYDDEWRVYIWKNRMFWARCVVAGMGSLLLLALILLSLGSINAGAAP